MASDDTITRWIKGVKADDSDACVAIWEHCFPELVRFARQRLQNRPPGVADEEDVALSAMDTFIRGIRDGRFADLADRNELLRLLLWITARKAADLIRRECSQKRGQGHVRGDSALNDDCAMIGDPHAVPPDLAMSVAEEVQRLMDVLDDSGFQAIAIAKMDGWHNEEIAAQQHCSVRTVERRLELIRRIWKREGPSESDRD